MQSLIPGTAGWRQGWRLTWARTLSVILALPIFAWGLGRDDVFAVRLATPVSSHRSKAGDAVEAVTLTPLTHEGVVAALPGSRVRGVVLETTKVGLGFKSESASLTLQFHRLETGPGKFLGIRAVVAEVENARERADAKGRIKGIRATAGPATRITSRLKYLPRVNPYTDPYLIAFKLTFPLFPEPEIMLPRGADLLLRLVEDPDANTLDPAETAAEQAGAAPDPGLAQWSEEIPYRASLPKSGRAADVINLAFLATQSEIHAAFLEAGWKPADRNTIQAFAKTIIAVTELRAYATAPMSRMLLGGRLPDFEFQKTFNSYEKRHHLRIWRLRDLGNGNWLWAAAATHDVSVTLSPLRFKLRHHIAPQIDDEREKVIWDLQFAGCVKRWWLAERTGAERRMVNGTGDEMVTDGRLGILQLQNCRPEADGAGSGVEIQHKPWGNHATRYLRRQILVLRSDLLRANLIYGAVDGVRLAYRGLRKPGSRSARTELARRPQDAPLLPDPDAPPNHGKRSSAEVSLAAGGE